MLPTINPNFLYFLKRLPCISSSLVANFVIASMRFQDPSSFRRRNLTDNIHHAGTTASVPSEPTLADIVNNLPQELQAEFDKGYNIPDFIRLIRTQHPETTQLIQLLILLCSSDRSLIKEVEKADGIASSSLIHASSSQSSPEFRVIKLIIDLY
jgi:hypothetical protein